MVGVVYAEVGGCVRWSRSHGNNDSQQGFLLAEGILCAHDRPADSDAQPLPWRLWGKDDVKDLGNIGQVFERYCHTWHSRPCQQEPADRGHPRYQATKLLHRLWCGRPNAVLHRCEHRRGGWQTISQCFVQRKEKSMRKIIVAWCKTLSKRESSSI